MNITDVGHLTSDADEGEDKMVKGAKREHKTVMEIAKFYTDAFFADCKKLNIKRPDVVQPATGQQGQLFPVQTVRPRAHGDAPAAGQGRHPLQQAGQAGGRAVGIGKGLQIGHEQAVAVRGGVLGVPGVPLGAQTETAQAQAGTGAAIVAEDAAPGGERAVPVGAGGARIQWNFLHPDAVFAPEIGGQGMPKQHDSRLFPGRFLPADRRKNLYCVRNSLTSSPF